MAAVLSEAQRTNQKPDGEMCEPMNRVAALTLKIAQEFQLHEELFSDLWWEGRAVTLHIRGFGVKSLTHLIFQRETSNFFGSI